MIANTFEVYTMKALSVMARIAGMESTANSRSVVSTTSNTTSSGVAYTPALRTEKLAAVVVLGHRHQFPEQAQHRVLLGMDLRLLLAKQLDPAVHQQRAERHR